VKNGGVVDDVVVVVECTPFCVTFDVDSNGCESIRMEFWLIVCTGNG